MGKKKDKQRDEDVADDALVGELSEEVAAEDLQPDDQGEGRPYSGLTDPDNQGEGRPYSGL